MESFLNLYELESTQKIRENVEFEINTTKRLHTFSSEKWLTIINREISTEVLEWFIDAKIKDGVPMIYKVIRDKYEPYDTLKINKTMSTWVSIKYSILTHTY